MIFEYRSSRTGIKKKLSDKLVDEIRVYLESKNINCNKTVGELQDILLEFKQENGDGLLINQLEPIFIYLSITGKIWEKD